MKYKEIRYEVNNSIATITLDRPEYMNALNLSMREELYHAINQSADDATVHVIILTGTGDKAFCAGGDITTMKNIKIFEGRERLKRVQRIILRIAEIEKVVIAAVNGYAVGGGFNLAIAADLIIASERAKFSQSFLNISVISDMGGLYFLPRKIGMAKAKELLFTGRTISADEADRIGLVNQVVPHDKCYESAVDLAMKISSGPQRTIGIMKSILEKSNNMDLRSILEMEALAQDICLRSPDHKEGVSAFLEKRKAVFNKVRD